MAELGRVQFGDATIEYDVNRSGRRKKTVQITMDGGRVLVASPLDTPDSKLEAIVRKRAPWILRQAPDPAIRASRKRFVSGETLPYLGRNVRLVVEPADVPSSDVRFDHWSFRINVPFGLDESKRYEGIRKAFVQMVPTAGRTAITPDGRTVAETDRLVGNTRECWFATSGSAGAAAPPMAPSASTGES